MTIVLTDIQMKDTFIEFVSKIVSKNVHDVTYWSVLNYMKRNCETLINDTASAALKMYTTSEDYEKDIEYLEERRRDWAKEWEEEQE